MILATATGLTRQFDSVPVFEDVHFEIRAGERIGLVGPNGAGKTTLLKLLVGEDKPDSGSLAIRSTVRLSLLRQQPDFAPGETLHDVARRGLGSLLDLQRQVEEAAQELAEAEDDADRARASHRFDELHHLLDHQDGYAVEHRIEEVLDGLRFARADYQRPAETFSGGQQSRLMLAKLLLENPDVMLLDEPSNHLDIETTAWLEEYLASRDVAMIVVSHDRWFLDKVVTKVWELHHHKITSYNGNYSHYWRQREERMLLLDKQYEKQQETIEELKAYIRKYGAGQRAKQAHDRERKLARIEQVERMRDIEGPIMGFGDAERSGDIVIEARKLAKAYDTPLFRDFNAVILRGKCVGILGPNGSGKTTLVKTLIGRLAPDSGDLKLGHKVKVGFYDQGIEAMPPETPVVRAIRPDDDYEWTEQELRDLLARFGLKGDIVFQTVGKLSGGERGKAALARLAASEANLLVMDEPTNHLDIWSCDALERSIREFEGTVLVVSHDRWFLNQVADMIIVLGEGRARLIEGNYETFQRLMQVEKERAEAGESAALASRKPEPVKPKRKRKFAYRKSADLEIDIAERERDIADLEDLLGQPATYRDPVRAKNLQLKHEELKKGLEALYAHLEEAMEFGT